MGYPDLTVNGAGHLLLGGADALDLAAEYGTPLYVLDEELVRARMGLYAAAMREYFPAGSRPLYASKALCCKELCRWAGQEGLGLDVVSAGELYTALAAGADPESLCFHGNAKTEDAVRYAVASGVGLIAADGTQELERIDRVAAALGVRQKVLLRVTPDIDPHTFKAVNTGVVDVKFGVPIPTGQALEAAKLALGLEHISLEGFHCHIGSQVFDAGPFRLEAEVMASFLGQVRRETGFIARTLNLGGGFAVAYTPEDPRPDLAGMLRDTGRRLGELFAGMEYPAPAILLEPGRSIVGDAGTTLYTVQNVKSVPGGSTYVALDGGMTDNPRYALYGARYAAAVADRAGQPKDAAVTLAGCCCESGDLIGENVPLQRPRAGDTVAVFVTGAYNYSMASNYNRVPRPPIAAVRGGTGRLIVRRETPEDLIRYDL